MFSGIVERTAEVVSIRTDRQNKDFTLRADFCKELKIDQSIAHNGVCLTVVDITEDTYTVTAMKETLDRSNLGLLREGDLVNLERSMKPDALLDGHIVQGHVDQTAVCTAKEDADGSWYFTFEYEPQGAGLCTVEKGSVTVNGVSLTVCDSKEISFRIVKMHYTFEHTNFCRIEVGSVVNLEFDIVGKYIARLMQNYMKKTCDIDQDKGGRVAVDRPARHGDRRRGYGYTAYRMVDHALHVGRGVRRGGARGAVHHPQVRGLQAQADLFDRAFARRAHQ